MPGLDKQFSKLKNFTGFADEISKFKDLPGLANG